MKDVDGTLRYIIEEHFGLEPRDIVEESKFVEDFKADSLDSIELMVEIEREFEIQIPDEEADPVKTYGDLRKLVLKHVGDMMGAS